MKKLNLKSLLLGCMVFSSAIIMNSCEDNKSSSSSTNANTVANLDSVKIKIGGVTQTFKISNDTIFAGTIPFVQNVPTEFEVLGLWGEALKTSTAKTDAPVGSNKAITKQTDGTYITRFTVTVGTIVKTYKVVITIATPTKYDPAPDAFYKTYTLTDALALGTDGKEASLISAASGRPKFNTGVTLTFAKYTAASNDPTYQNGAKPNARLTLTGYTTDVDPMTQLGYYLSLSQAGTGLGRLQVLAGKAQGQTASTAELAEMGVLQSRQAEMVDSLSLSQMFFTGTYTGKPANVTRYTTTSSKFLVNGAQAFVEYAYTLAVKAYITQVGLQGIQQQTQDANKTISDPAKAKAGILAITSGGTYTIGTAYLPARVKAVDVVGYLSTKDFTFKTTILAGTDGMTPTEIEFTSPIETVTGDALGATLSFITPTDLTTFPATAADSKHTGGFLNKIFFK
jgi:hypothetical protein